ncbi:MAG: hypothetical protein F6J87_27225 [Spirulina sp. SIO3F2]|nr:hypothetical protein [Spirulina sp. SIO3F2]
MVLSFLTDTAFKFAITQAVQDHVVPLVLEILEEQGGGLLGRLQRGINARLEQAIFSASECYVENQVCLFDTVQSPMYFLL